VRLDPRFHGEPRLLSPLLILRLIGREFSTTSYDMQRRRAPSIDAECVVV
jgi:hypothetical protein